MKLVFCTSPHVRHVSVLESSCRPDPSVMYNFAPVGLLSLIATLRRDRPEVSCSLYDVNRQVQRGVLPMNERFYAATASDILSHAPQIVGLMTECDSYHHVLQICAALKQEAPGCRIILGGPHASAVGAETMRKHRSIDAIVVGEGEITLPELLDRLDQHRSVPGALVRALDGSVIDGGPRALVDDLDDLPIPAYDSYRPDPGEEVFVEVGRGCPFKCSFCSTAPYWRRRHRVKSPARILAEIERLRDLYGTSRVHFTHDLFTTHSGWVRSVCDTLIDAGSPVSWTCSARTDTVDPPLLAAMAEAGCSAIYFGIESGSDRVLKEIGKAIPLDRTWMALKQCRAAGITPNVGFIVGFPSEDAGSFDATFVAYEKALRSGCSPAHIFAFCPFADSSIYGTLTSLGCDGHFIDLPLGAAQDTANRALIKADSHLYGAFHRPRLPTLLSGIDHPAAGADEFSPLVEATLAPALALAKILGGMVRVYELWISWIRARNADAGQAAHRLSYGAPTDFADFLIEKLSAEDPIPAGPLAAARLLRVNLSAPRARVATTMANHRSLGARLSPEAIGLATRIVAEPVIATLALDRDATPALAGASSTDYQQQPTFYVWQAVDDGGVRLLQVSEVVFTLLTRLRGRTSSVSDLIVEQLSDRRGEARVASADVLGAIEVAAEQGLVSVGR